MKINILKGLNNSAGGLSLFIGLGFFLFLFLLKPFQIELGTSHSGHTLVERSLIYGFWAFWAFFAWEQILDRLWLKRLFQFISLYLFLLFSLNYFWGGHDWSLEVFFEMFWQGSLLAALLILLYRAIFRRVGEDKGSLEKEEYLQFIAENGKDRLEIKSSQFLFAKSDGNYLVLETISGDSLKSKLLRKSLKAQAEDFEDKGYLLRVHKQFLVNLKKVESLDRKGQKLSLILEGGLKVPVGQAYLENFNRAWQNFAPK